jgi:hypothetical protein
MRRGRQSSSDVIAIGQISFHFLEHGAVAFADVCSGAHYELKSDIAQSPKSAQ